MILQGRWRKRHECEPGIVGVDEDVPDQQEIYVCIFRISIIKYDISIELIIVIICLACAPLPTEDSSSSPGDGANDGNECQNNSILSDSDDRQDFKLALRIRQPCVFGNFESDSLNENFSPTR